MASERKKIQLSAASANKRRGGAAKFRKALRIADTAARTKMHSNRPADRRRFKSVKAAIAQDYDGTEDSGILLRLFRWLLGLAILPLCALTTLTFFDQFSEIAQDRGFWVDRTFWYFATGVLLMGGWFTALRLARGKLWDCFLYLYVLGHELTHILFIWLFRGRVEDWGVKASGGYVTTDKNNIIIALAPYFLPLWAVVILVGFSLTGLFMPLTPTAMKTFYALLGFFWGFHVIWTVWMIQHDQPDLRENGVFLSLNIIFLTNLCIVIALTIAASPSMTTQGFVTDWCKHASDLASSSRHFLGGLDWKSALRP
ncbi:MAG: hypothetical protein MUF31_07095 [Akkermansiaceae bacterium]|jgi:hypothetical protein|nr:hypothetical protein [Akkermansiaceae bacterium]